MTATVATAPAANAAAGATRALLLGGVVAGPLFTVAVLAQAAARDGFDPARQPLSLLALGPYGWVQVTAFLLTGALVVASAAGLRRALHPGRAGTWGPILLAVHGLGLIAAGLFPADPEGGTWPGVVHDSAAGVGGFALLAAFLVLSRRLLKAGCIVVPVADLALSGAAGATGDFRLLLAAGIADWLWASVVLWAIRRRR